MAEVPTLDADEAFALENLFRAHTDRTLIRELIRRRRLRVVNYNQMYFTELAQDEDYMRGIDGDLTRSLAGVLTNKAHVLFRDTHRPPPAKMAVREASIIVLREAGAKDDD